MHSESFSILHLRFSIRSRFVPEEMDISFSCIASFPTIHTQRIRLRTIYSQQQGFNYAQRLTRCVTSGDLRSAAGHGIYAIRDNVCPPNLTRPPLSI